MLKELPKTNLFCFHLNIQKCQKINTNSLLLNCLVIGQLNTRTAEFLQKPVDPSKKFESSKNAKRKIQIVYGISP